MPSTRMLDASYFFWLFQMNVPKLPRRPERAGVPPIVTWVIQWISHVLAIYFLSIIALGLLYGLALLVSDVLLPGQ
jgi:hypothetical protein